MTRNSRRDAIPESERCKPCDGYGDVWVGWSAYHPVQCGHCHGTGRHVSHAQAIR
jgi:DnaJ-class molecular chaperone